MSTPISRAQFLRGDFRGDRTAVRPPWAVSEKSFFERCNSCGDCINACPTHILQPARGHFPAVDFKHGECTFCRACLEACHTGALRADIADAPWTVRAVIGDGCLTKHGVICRTCGEQCESRAIRFRPAVGRVSQPELSIEQCNGCGACVAPCPANALSLHYDATMSSKITSKEMTA